MAVVNTINSNSGYNIKEISKQILEQEQRTRIHLTFERTIQAQEASRQNEQNNRFKTTR